MSCEATKQPATPADRLIEEFGVKRLANWSGRHASRVRAWAWPPERGGKSHRVVPHLRHRHDIQRRRPRRGGGVRGKIIAGAAAELKAELTFADFEPRPGESYLLDGDRSGDPNVLAAGRAS